MEMVKRYQKRCACAVLAGMAGLFLVIRLKAFLLQAFELELVSWCLYALILLFAFAGGVFADAVFQFLRRWAMIPSLSGGVICGMSMVVVVLFRGIITERAMENSGVVMSGTTMVLYLLGGGILLGVFSGCLLTAIRERVPGIKVTLKRISIYDVVFLLLLLVGINVLTRIYAMNSSTIYYWDNAGYWQTANQLAARLVAEGWWPVFRAIYDSVLTLDYNYLIAVPAMVFARLFGEGRYAFLLSIANFGYYPICIIVWYVSKKLTKRPVVTTLVVLCMIPMLFVNVLKGFVDVAGCVMTLAAVLLWISLEKHDFGKALLIGLCLAGAVLMRRWYSFFAVSFILTLVVDGIVFRKSPVPLLGVTASFAFVLLFFFQPLVSQRMLMDYGNMYVAYSQAMRNNFVLLFYYYGWIPLLVTAAVDVYLIIKRQTRNVGVFVLLQTLLCFLMFVRIQTHGQQHLLLYVPVQITMSLFLSIKLQSLKKEQAVAGMLLLSAIPVVLPFFPRYLPANVDEIRGLEPYPSFSWYPPQREDAGEMVDLMRRLDKFGEEGKTVGLLASSFVINHDILVNAEASLSLPRVSDVSRSYFRSLPQVDQRDGWGEALYDCDVLVVADPVQLHLGEENQAVVHIPAEALLSGTGMAAAYKCSEEVWSMSNGITVYFFERVREVSQEEKDYMQQMFLKIHKNN